MARVFIGLGSNINDRKNYLERAILALDPEIQLKSASSIYETDPWGYEDQDDFLNQVISTETDLEPREVLEKLKAIEESLGRTVTIRYGPRVIDLDLLFYDDLVLDECDLQIPHPRMLERAFVLVPFCEIASDFVHPVLNRTLKDLCAEITSKGIRLYEEK